MLGLENAISRLAAAHRERVAGRPRHAGVIVNEHTLTAAECRRHVEILGRRFEFIHHDDLLERIERPRGRPFCLLTFDDGKRSGYTATAPELERHGVPAVFYVTTRYLSEGGALWFDRYEALLASLGRAPAGLERSTLKTLPIALLEERVERACAKYGVAPDMADDDIRPMSWDEARDLSRRGFTIGAHGRRHAILTRETRPDAMQDIEQSIRDVSVETRTPCVTFAFPNGNYTRGLALHALACGARTSMTTEPLWADRRFPPWRLPRIQLFGPQSRVKIDLKLTLAATGCLLANPDGSGRSYRRAARAARDGGSPDRSPEW